MIARCSKELVELDKDLLGRIQGGTSGGSADDPLHYRYYGSKAVPDVKPPKQIVPVPAVTTPARPKG